MHKHDINQTKKAQTEGNINVVTEQNNKQKIKMIELESSGDQGAVRRMVLHLFQLIIKG